MFSSSDERCFFDGSDSNEDDDGDGENSDRDREEIEAALYAQIHFDQDEDGNLSFNGYSTSVQTLGPESAKIVHDGGQNSPFTNEPSAATTLQSPPSTNNCVVSLSLGEESVYVVSDSDDSDLADSECMILDESLSDAGDIMVHVNSCQQPALQEAQMAAREENDVFKISEMDQKTTNPGLNRYYKPITVRCYNCKEMGHISNVCPKPKKSEICHLCGMTGHFFRKCPEGICYNCEGPGHNSYDCPEQRKHRRQTCYRCLMPGHSKTTCPDIWRQFHITTSVGPVKKMEMKTNPKRYCSNCASRKHFGYECVKKRMEWHENGNYPFISTYTHRDERFNRGNYTHRDKCFNSDNYTYRDERFNRDKKPDNNPKPQKKKNENNLKRKKKKTGNNSKQKKKNPKNSQKGKKENNNNWSRNWDNMVTTGAYKGTKRKYQEESAHPLDKGQGKRRKTNNSCRDGDAQKQPKSQKRKEKQGNENSNNTGIRVKVEPESYKQSGQGEHRTQNNFNKDGDAQKQPKSQQRKEKQGNENSNNTGIRVKVEPESYKQSGQGEHRTQNNFNKDGDAQKQPKSQQRKEKQGNENSNKTGIRVKVEPESYKQSSQNNFNKGRNECMVKAGYQPYNPPHKKNKTNNFDRGFKTHYHNKIPLHQNK